MAVIQERIERGVTLIHKQTGEKVNNVNPKYIDAYMRKGYVKEGDFKAHEEIERVAREVKEQEANKKAEQAKRASKK